MKAGWPTAFSSRPSNWAVNPLAEVDELLAAAAITPHLKPLIEDAPHPHGRDLGFPRGTAPELEAYVQAVPEADFERFLVSAPRHWKSVCQTLPLLAVLKRLKDR